MCVCVCLLSERWHGEISEGGGGEDAKGHHSVLFPRGHQLGSSDRIPQVQLLLLPFIHGSVHCTSVYTLCSESSLSVSSETFSFVLTEIDGSRRNGYCRRLLVSVQTEGVSSFRAHFLNFISNLSFFTLKSAAWRERSSTTRGLLYHQLTGLFRPLLQGETAEHFM